MKTAYLSKFTATVLALVFCLTSHAQGAEKQRLNSIKKGIPYHVPLAKKDFQMISSQFGYRKHPILKKNRLHSGIDLAAPKGAAVLATASGVIENSGFQKGYGNYITIQHLSNVETLYAHLSKNLVKKGEIIFQGQIIGYVGSTGLATGSHLHYEIRINGKKIDPLMVWRKILKEYSINKV